MSVNLEPGAVWTYDENGRQRMNNPAPRATRTLARRQLAQAKRLLAVAQNSLARGELEAAERATANAVVAAALAGETLRAVAR